MTSGGGAELSVVIVTDHYRTIRKVVELLSLQTVRERLELVLVAPSEEALGLVRAEVEVFGGTKVVSSGSIIPLAAARVAGIRAATASLVALLETHVYPDPAWAEALIEAHRADWAGVGPAFTNANPGSTASWASLLMDYGVWAEPATAGVVRNVPAINSCYKRAALLEQPANLESGFNFGPDLHKALRAHGHELYFATAAKVAHLNVSRVGPWAAERYLLGRWLAAERASRWPAHRRVAYAGAAPLIPIVRFWRILRGARGAIRAHRLLPRVLPALTVGILLSTVGELVGFVFGAGDARDRLAKYEVRKVDYVSEPEYAEL